MPRYVVKIFTVCERICSVVNIYENIYSVVNIHHAKR